MLLNPLPALNAIFPCNIKICEGVEVYPLTLAHYALLEKIHSYLVIGDHEPDSLETVKTFYICTHDAKEIFKNLNDLDAKAIEWATYLPPSIVNDIADAVKQQIDAMSKVVPVIGEDGKKKETVETDI